MYGIFTYMSLKNDPNVGKYSIHGAYGYSEDGDFPVRKPFAEQNISTHQVFIATVVGTAALLLYLEGRRVGGDIYGGLRVKHGGCIRETSGKSWA